MFRLHSIFYIITIVFFLSIPISSSSIETGNNSTQDTEILLASEDGNEITDQPKSPSGSDDGGKYIQTLTFLQLIILIGIITVAVLVIFIVIIKIGGNVKIGKYVTFASKDGQKVQVTRQQIDSIVLLVYAFRIKDLSYELDDSTIRRQRRRVRDEINHLKEIMLIIFQEARHDIEKEENYNSVNINEIQKDVLFLLFTLNLDRLYYSTMARIMSDIEDEDFSQLKLSEYHKKRSEEVFRNMYDSINRFYHDYKIDYTLRSQIVQLIEKKKPTIVEKIRSLYEELYEIEKSKLDKKYDYENQLISTISEMYDLDTNSVKVLLSNINSEYQNSNIFSNSQSKKE